MSDIAVKAIACAICALGIGLVGIAEGLVAMKAAEGVARNPEASDKVRSTIIIGIALTETEAIYALVIAILIMFVL